MGRGIAASSKLCALLQGMPEVLRLTAHLSVAQLASYGHQMTAISVAERVCTFVHSAELAARGPAGSASRASHVRSRKVASANSMPCMQAKKAAKQRKKVVHLDSDADEHEPGRRRAGTATLMELPRRCPCPAYYTLVSCRWTCAFALSTVSTAPRYVPLASIWELLDD